MKKFLSLLCLGALLCAFGVACGNPGAEPEKPDTEKPEPEGAKFYYANDEKIYLYEVEGMVVAVYEDGSHLVTSDDEALDDDKIVSVRPLLAAKNDIDGSYYEMPYINQITVDFKGGIIKERKDGILKKYDLTLVKTSTLSEVFSVPAKLDPLDVANAIQESGLANYSYPYFVTSAVLFP